MTPDQIAEAQRLAREWRPEPELCLPAMHYAKSGYLVAENPDAYATAGDER